MAPIPTGPQVGAVYTLIGPDGTRVVFNDDTDADYIGMLTDVGGLDSPDIRESAEDLVEMDGGVHGDFFASRRPITLTGMIFAPSDIDERNRRMTALMQASGAYRHDAKLSWVLEGGYEQQVMVRRQQPLRIQGGWVKEFQLAVVAADPRIYAAILRTEDLGAAETPIDSSGMRYPITYPFNYGIGFTAGQTTIENSGNTPTWPIFRVYGPGANPTLINATSGERLSLTYTMSDTDFLEVDTFNRTVLLNGESSRYSAVNFTDSSWWPIYPGDNIIRLAYSSYSTGARLTVEWRDAWL